MVGTLRVRGGPFALAILCALALGACVPFGGDPFAPSPDPSVSAPAAVVHAAEQSRGLLDYTIDLPDGWNDLTDEYLAQVPNSVLSGYWTMADDLSTDGPYVTMSLFPLSPDTDTAEASEQAAQKWEADMGDPVRGDSGYAETAQGGVITWTSVTGDFDGEQRSEHLAHIFYGPYYMYVEVDTPAGDEGNAHALLDALETVTITGPLFTGQRAGAPVAVDGRWTSYCGTIQADAQSDWHYTFTQSFDSVVWRCPEHIDYLGEWSVNVGSALYNVEVERTPDVDLASRRSQLSVPAAVGESAKTPHGSTIELLSEAAFGATGGGQGVRIDLATTIPGSDAPFISSAYLLEDSSGGVTLVFVSTPGGEVVPQTTWLEPFIATITTPSAS